MWIPFCLLVLFGTCFRRDTRGVLAATPTLPSSELSALYDFYNATRGWNWIVPARDGVAWNFSQKNPNPCTQSWVGVLCDCGPKICHIQALNLTSNNVSGTIPPSISSLVQLQRLVLRGNYLTSSLPTSIGALSALSFLDLSYNDLVSPIPDSMTGLSGTLLSLLLGHNSFHDTIPAFVYNLTRLITLQLDNNVLGGSIPTAIAQLSSLVTLRLDGNLLTSTLPPTIYSLPSLVTLSLGDNFLWGTVSNNVGNLTRLHTLWLGNNAFTGSIPSALGRIRNMTSVDLAQNNIHGSLPPELGDMPARLLRLNFNLLTGTFPTQMLNLDVLGGLYVDHNLLSGLLPFGIWDHILSYSCGYNLFAGRLPSNLYIYHTIQFLGVAANFLSGTIGDSIGDVTSMVYLAMSNNFLTGTVPESLTTIPGLAQIYLDNNLLSGSLPEQLASVTFLGELYLSNNLLTGTLSRELVSMPSLFVLNVGTNLFNGNLSFLNIANYTGQLTNLDISFNQFVGTFPTAVFRLPSLTSLTATGNCISGTLSEAVCQSQLQFLALDGVGTARSCRNYIFPAWTSMMAAYRLIYGLEGTVPSCIFDSPSMQSLHLSGNQLGGSLKSDLKMGKGWMAVVLSHNRLTGSIPKALQVAPLQTLDLSFNRFSGSLLPDFAAPRSSNASVSLRVNSLSGKIPDGLQQFLDINMLDGNMFSCQDRTELPQHDPSVEVYVCGSSEVDRSLFVWAAMLGALGASLALLRMSTPRWLNGARHIVAIWVQQAAVFANEEAFTAPSVRLFVVWMRRGRWIFAALITFLCVVLVPAYCALSVAEGVYLYRYGWMVSALLLQGATTSWMLCACFCAILLWFVLWSHSLTAAGIWRIRVANREGAILSSHTTASEESRQLPHSEVCVDRRHSRAVRLGLLVVTAVNAASMVALDVTYVIVYFRSSTSVVFAVQVLTAVVKIWWNDSAMWVVLWYCKAYFLASSARPTAPVSDVNDSARSDIPLSISIRAGTSLNSDFSVDDATRLSRISDREVRVMAFNLLLNSIVAPGVAIACVSSKCFYNALVAAPTVRDDFDTTQCGFIVTASGRPTCAFDVTVVQSTNYDPPYSYSYQCGSVISADYAPVYVYMYLIVGLVLPPLRLFLQYRSHHLVAVGNSGPATGEGSGEAPLSWVTQLLNALTTEQLIPASQRRHCSEFVFLRRERFTVRLTTVLGVLLTFGVLYPPLGVICGVAGICQMVAEQGLMGGTFLELQRQAQLGSADAQQLLDRLPGEVRGFLGLFRRCAWLVLPFGSTMLAFVVFDTMGYDQGWFAALAPALVVWLLPTCLVVGFTWMWFRKSPLVVHRTQAVSAERSSALFEIDEHMVAALRPSLLPSIVAGMAASLVHGEKPGTESAVEMGRMTSVESTRNPLGDTAVSTDQP